MILSCFKCSKKLQSAVPTDKNQPRRGTCFMSYGHYGSTFIDSEMGDPPGGGYIEINICDDCLRTNMSNILFVGKNP